MFFLQIIWLYLPLGIANIFASLSRRILPRWGYPLDFNKQFKGARLLGGHKTVRGLLFGVAAAFLFFLCQKYLYDFSSSLRANSLIDYQTAGFWLGAVMGLGAMLGDAVKSFFKRRLNIAPGQPWFPLDQLDWVLGGVLLSWPFVNIEFLVVITAIALGLLFHLLFKVIGYALGFDKDII